MIRTKIIRAIREAQVWPERERLCVCRKTRIWEGGCVVFMRKKYYGFNKGVNTREKGQGVLVLARAGKDGEREVTL